MRWAMRDGRCAMGDARWAMREKLSRKTRSLQLTTTKSIQYKYERNKQNKK